MELKKERKFIQNEAGYFLGINQDNERVYLICPKWDCGHYWGCGYISTYGGMSNTERNFSMHTHFKGYIIGQQEKYNSEKQVFEKDKYTYHLNEVLKESVLSEHESWVLSELMNSIYILKETSEFYNSGSAHITENPLRNTLINDEEYKRINKILLPLLFKEVDKLLKADNQTEKEFILEDNQINTSNGGRY